MSNQFQVVRDFEEALCDYTGATYAVSTTSCTMALLLSLSWKHHVAKALGEPKPVINIPRRTYVGVPMSVLNAGFRVCFRDEEWSGEYPLKPTNLWDSARRFYHQMYQTGMMQCVSFHWTKILSIGQGGAILHDNKQADAWLRRARFDGRTEGVKASEDVPRHLGYHAYMSPRDAAEGLTRLATLPLENDDLPWDDYPDLSQMDIFK